jgi:CheY-like chemotaxis protein
VNKDLIILLTEDNEGQVMLVKMNLRNAGIRNEIIHFWHGGEVLDFLFRRGSGPHRRQDTAYLLLLDIRMPVVDGVETLRIIKQDPELRLLPVIMLTTSADEREIERCHALGCNAYVTKPMDAVRFIEAIQNLGLFIQIVDVPHI